VSGLVFNPVQVTKFQTDESKLKKFLFLKWLTIMFQEKSKGFVLTVKWYSIEHEIFNADGTLKFLVFANFHSL
jgi:hypothetical protein